MWRTSGWRVVMMGLAVCAGVAAKPGLAAAGAQAGGTAPQSLFDGRSLDGWRAVGPGAPVSAASGALVCGGPGSGAVYVGGPGGASFDGFVWTAEVLTAPGGDARLQFHTPPDGSGASPAVIIRNSPAEGVHAAGLERTGSLAGVRHVFKSTAVDQQWFILTVTARKPFVEVRVNGALVVEYREPATWPAGVTAAPALGRGTFALRCDGAREGLVRLRNINVRPLTAVADVGASPEPVVDDAYAQILELTRAGFPVIDLHAHLKGTLTLDDVLALARRTGMFMGLAVNCGKGFPIERDPGAVAFAERMRGKPVFFAMQAEGREWMQMFSKEARTQFDYVFTDGMTWTNPAGRRMRLWMPDEVEIGKSEQAFMDLLVSKIVGILDQEPIDIYVNPTFLPAVIAARYDTLWTPARMKKVVDALARNHVALEINARYRIPSERFLRLAKQAGVRFTFGTNNASEKDLGDWSYPLAMQKALALTPADMWVPGRAPTRAQRDLQAGATGQNFGEQTGPNNVGVGLARRRYLAFLNPEPGDVLIGRVSGDLVSHRGGNAERAQGEPVRPPRQEERGVHGHSGSHPRW